jgi:hypothetical protein
MFDKIAKNFDSLHLNEKMWQWQNGSYLPLLSSMAPNLPVKIWTERAWQGTQTCREQHQDAS